jgi:branched-chain amino acid transport system permease protein/neutral amino acid transport system permease protein
VIPAIGFGLVSAAVLGIASIGFTIQFAMTNILNLAYGAIMGVGIFGGYYAETTLGANQWLSIIAGALFGAASSYLFYVIFLLPFLRRGSKPLTMVVITVAASTVIIYSVQIIVGPQLYSYPAQLGRLHKFAGFELTTLDLWIIAIAVVIMLLTTGLLRLTTFGKAMRATAANRILAAASGVPVRQITGLAWLLSGALCGIGGVVFTMSVGNFDYETGTLFLTEVFAAAVLGGVGNPVGAMVGALVVGVASEVAAAYSNPEFKDVFAFSLLIVVLLARPSGLMGTAQQHEALAQ